MKIAKRLIAFCGLPAVDRPYGVSMDNRVMLQSETKRAVRVGELIKPGRHLL
jgi:hypothetical protein